MQLWMLTYAIAARMLLEYVQGSDVISIWNAYE
jgi:hypothetical protein